MFKWFAAVLLLLAETVIAAPAGARAEDDAKTPVSKDKSSHDARLVEALKDILDRGADIYNSGDRYGCYRLFQGALLAVQADLKDHKELQVRIENILSEAEKDPNNGRRAWALREVLVDLRQTLKGKPAAKKAEGASLWDRLGGEANVKKIVDDFTAMATNDPKANFTRGGKYKLDDKAVAHLKQTALEFLSSTTGGPYKYTGRNVKEVHKGMGITDAEFDAVAADFKKALEKNGVRPADIAIAMKNVELVRSIIVEVRGAVGKPAKAKPEEKAKDR